MYPYYITVWKLKKNPQRSRGVRDIPATLTCCQLQSFKYLIKQNIPTFIKLLDPKEKTPNNW